MKKQVSRQKQFITMVTGGPNKYEGADMKTAHLKFKIGKKEFDETWHNLVKSLNFFKFPSQTSTSSRLSSTQCTTM
jgi:truncated hemoglobin YjbI